MKAKINNWLVQQDFYDITTNFTCADGNRKLGEYVTTFSKEEENGKLYLQIIINEDETIRYPYDTQENLDNDYQLIYDVRNSIHYSKL